PELGQSSEALQGVSLLAQTLRHEGVPSPTLDRLAALVEGRIEPESFTAGLTAPDGLGGPAQATERIAAALARRRPGGISATLDDPDDAQLAGVCGESGARRRPE
ncbi:MAG: hypothetical protein M3401_00890, partial [Actinomycetota bacterium]|nr:hypothetical protein [Actinomycetota bacterium]